MRILRKEKPFFVGTKESPIEDSLEDPSLTLGT